VGAASAGRAGASSTPVVLTLKRAVELSLSNSKDIQLAKLQVHGRRTRRNSRERNSFPICRGVGSGLHIWIAGNAGRTAAALFSVTYTEQVLNGRCGPGERTTGASAGPTGGAGGYAERGDGARASGYLSS